MDNIRIVKLQNGEDLVGTLTTNEFGNYILEEPMAFEIDFRNNSSGLIMRHWLPVQLIKKNEIELTHKDVLAVLEPAEDFIEYYSNTVERIKELLAAKNAIDGFNDDELQDMIEDFEALKNNGDTIH